MAKSKVVICPYCGETQPAADRCRTCAGLFEPLSRQATHNAMGPWFIRDPARPFQPGCSYETLVRLIRAGRVTRYSILRGPTTRQFWTVARHIPGVAHILGYCHQCDAEVDTDAVGCPNCGTPFGAYLDRNYLGLPDIKPLPGEATLETPAAESPTKRPTSPSSIPSTPRGGTLSRFATDEELFAPAPAPGMAPGVAFSPGPGPTEPPMPTQQPPVAGHHDDESLQSYAHTAARRALERRLHKEQRLVRILIILFLLTFAILILGNLGTFRNWLNSPPPPESTSPPDATNPEPPEPPESPESPEPSELPETTPPDTDADAADGDGSLNDTETSPPSNGDVAAIPPYERLITEVLDLATRARNSERDRDLRRADLERAIVITLALEVDPEVPADQQPRLQSILAGLREDLERLELLDFFPD